MFDLRCELTAILLIFIDRMNPGLK